MRFLIVLFLCCCSWSVPHGLQAQTAAALPLQRFGVVLLLPDAQMQDRVQSIDAMATYLKAVEAAVARVTAQPGWAPNAGFVVLVVRPGPEARVWWDWQQALPAAQQQALTDAVAAVPPFVARRGPVVVALKLGWGGATEPQRRAPAPPEWKAVAQAAGRALPLDDLVLAAWPMAPFQAASAASAP
ncbi:MAG: hypothetical protein C4K60_14615 [Ideonella sp. MAG2]|nr:MAG: hypothetical protein C4K60_14615 [Ideonella sp. MAG2]